MGLRKLCRWVDCGFTKCAISLAMVFLLASICAAQVKTQSAETPLADDLKKYPGLAQEFEKLFNKVQEEVDSPPVRKQSKLLPLLPESTLYYAALPNYGDAAHKALVILHQELQVSNVLREWWQHGELAKNGPVAEQMLENFSRLSQYIGDEIVITGSTDSPEHNVVFMAEVRKSGLRDFVQQMLKQIPSTSKPPVRVLDLQELASATDGAASQGLVVLIRPDFVIAAPRVKAVRDFNDLLESKGGSFGSTEFGQRLMRAYDGGASVLAGADLQQLLKQVPQGAAENQEILARTGFGDVKYLIWEHKNVVGEPASQTELSFTGPRHGVASWLAAPTPMNTLSFVSPKPLLVTTLVLKNWSEILDDVRSLATASNPNAWASFDQMQQMMNLNVKRDLLSHFDGEITLELDTVEPPNPAWRAIVRVNHPEGLQQTLDRLLATGPFSAESFDEGNVRYHALHVPSRTNPMEVVYALVDGYLVIGSNHEAVTEAVQFHTSGGSLRASPKFVSALPTGHPAGASALFYEDPAAMTAFALRTASPEAAGTLLRFRQDAPPIVVAGYGEETAIRSASTNTAADAASIMIVAAIAIPNLLRARMAANEASAVANLRTLNTAEIVYSTTYPQKGYARDMASLGPDPRGPQFTSARHAAVVNAELGGETCTAGTWCMKSGYKFTIKGICGQVACKDFVATATPVDANTGTRSFCSTSDGVVRYQLGGPLTSPVSAPQCKAWTPVQ